MREPTQREYDRGTKEMDNIYNLSPIMRETLSWLGRDGVFGCPGTDATFKALHRRGLVSRIGVMRPWRLTKAGRAALPQ